MLVELGEPCPYISEQFITKFPQRGDENLTLGY